MRQLLSAMLHFSLSTYAAGTQTASITSLKFLFFGKCDCLADNVIQFYVSQACWFVHRDTSNKRIVSHSPAKRCIVEYL